MAAEFILPIVFFGGPLLAVLVYLSYVLLFRLQIRYVELLFTLLISMFPFGAVLTRLSDNPDKFTTKEYVSMIVAALFPALLFFAGSIWGMSAIKRLQEARSLQRCLYLAAGWGLVTGMFAALGALILGIFLCSSLWQHRQIEFKEEVAGFLILLGMVLLGLPGLLIERRCLKQARMRPPNAD